VIERNRQIDGDPEDEPAVSVRFFVLKTLLEKQIKAVTIDNTKPGIQFEIPQNSYAVHGVPLCRDGNTWDFRRAVNEHAVWIPWDEIIVTPEMVNPSSSFNPYNYLGQRPYRREYDDTSSSSLVYSIDKLYAEKLVEFAFN